MARPTWIGYKLNERYEIEQELGSGGMSAVYKANDPNLKRVVAIKLIHSHLSSNPDFVRRFEIEASAVAQLRHPNIVQVFDFNHDGDTYYMVLEFVPGESLQERLKRLSEGGRRLRTEEAIELAAKVCDAVDYAHKRGLVHRDIKPANVMINVQGEPILMDFGIVKILGGTQHTATGAVVGTALYMSPEQIRGEHPDHRADIYSLGVMLFEMVSGRPPYAADSAMTIMMMHLNDPVPDVTSIASEIPPGFKNILERALAKDPNQRYQSAGELAAAIRSLKTSGERLTAAPAAGTVVETPGPQATYVESQPSTRPPVGGGATYIEPAGPAAAPVSQKQPAPVQARPAAASKKPNNRALLFGGGAALIALLACIVIAALVLPGMFAGLGSGDGNGGDAQATEPGVALVDSTATPEPTIPAPTSTTAPPTDTPAPTETPTITPTPTATQPEGPYVLITEISIESGAYIVSYQTFNFDPRISSTAGTMHMHFFWNIYEPITAGINGIGDSTGGGSWALYDVPSPFRGFAVSARPANATQICVLVANHDHSINLDTGNCYDLPE